MNFSSDPRRLGTVHGSQLFLDSHTPPLTPGAGNQSVWSDSLVFPAYFATISVLAALLYLISNTRLVRNAFDRLFISEQVDHETSILQDPLSFATGGGLCSIIYQHAKSLGGFGIFVFRLTRLLSCLVLLILEVILLLFEKHDWRFTSYGEYWLKRYHNSLPSMFTYEEWLHLAMCITYTYASIIAVTAVCARARLANLANTHLVLVLFSTWGVYAYRDLYPFATFTLSPVDISESLLWVKIGILSFAAIVIPIIIPSQYIPFDPKDPILEPSPEQTASWFSRLLYFFLDPVIVKASRVAHLPATELPPLADYDRAENLVKTSFRYLDPASSMAKRHVFFGLMKVFRREYLGMACLLIVWTSSSLMAPIAINRLLSYLESESSDAAEFFRPWVWIALLFFAPFLGTTSLQWYLFLTTRTSVRTQGIITQLVFEHSLRVRMKAESSGSSEASTSVPSSPTTGQSESPASNEGSCDGTSVPTSATSTTTVAADSASEPETITKRPGSITDEDTKSLRSVDTKKSEDLVGRINNLVSTDLENVIGARDFLLFIISSPLLIAISIWFLHSILGWSSFVGMILMIILFPIQAYSAKLIQAFETQRLKMTDARVQSVTEAMNVIRMIKLFGWERKMNDRLAEKRDDELRYQRKRQLLVLLSGTITYSIPVIAMAACFACYTLIMKQKLTASRVFSAMSVFDLLREHMFLNFNLVPSIVQGKVSLDRVSNFLYKTELLDSFSHMSKDSLISDDVVANRELIGLRNATFTWSNEVQNPSTPSSLKRRFRLRVDDELIFKKGKINLIIGPTGSGKTSLIMALLGELHYIPSGPDSWFNLPRDGGVAYAAQESWVQNETIRDNILFGAPFDEARYKKVIVQCGLGRDLALFEASDKTEVGEKGLSLSGGQKARITLARAVYSRAQILIFDDVLAALDVHTARWIVNKCFKGDLIRGRTVLLVTHNVAMTSSIADFVVSVGSDGRILGQGTSSSVLKLNSGLGTGVEPDRTEIQAEDEVDGVTPDLPASQGSSKLIVAEEIAEGHISKSALKLFFVAMAGSYTSLFWLLVIVSFGLTELTIIVQTWYLGYWAAQYDSNSNKPVQVEYYLSIYICLLMAALALYAIAICIFIFGSLRASRTIHMRLIRSIFGTTLRWLDSTPVSRVIARCTQDMASVDGPVPRYLSSLVHNSLSMLLRFCAVVAFSPAFIFLGIGVAVLGAWCSQMYIKAQLCVKREMSNARSPVLGHFGAAIAGIVSIRAYQSQPAFRKESLDRIDRYSRAARTFYNLNGWIAMRIDTLGALFSTLLAVYLVYGPGREQKQGYGAQTGFSLNMAVGFSGLILSWVRLLNEFEISGNSLERIQHFITIEQEPKPTEAGVPPAYWPASGDVRVENLSASYSQDGPKVLHDVSFHIASGERVGVVGRTGSGKSSLTLSLLRCINTEGKVYFDNIPTDKVNLEALRSNITIIPQIPELLSGTLRENLDPFEQYDDATLNDALRAAGLFSIQDEEDESRITLETSISSGGGNLSVGQRQILALARAIVRKSKLLIMDEATSAIDYETDSVIQSSLRHELGGDVTLFTIAHRLQTIMDADKIMVLDAGQIVEFGKPSDLLKIEGGMLRALVDDSGDKEALHAMAQGVGQNN